jgi:hypothetical protein
MPAAGLEPVITSIGRLQIYVLDRTATRVGLQHTYSNETSATHELACKYVQLVVSYFLSQMLRLNFQEVKVCIESAPVPL